MGEGVIEATINKWLIKKGEVVKEDDPLVEISTDKVDTEVPAPSGGEIAEITAAEGSVVKVGETIAILESEIRKTPEEQEKVKKEVGRIKETIEEVKKEEEKEVRITSEAGSRTPSGKFLSPLIRNIAAQEGVSYIELDTITGTGMDGRITRDDVTKYLEERKKKSGPVPRPVTGTKPPEKEAGPEEAVPTVVLEEAKKPAEKSAENVTAVTEAPGQFTQQGDEIIEMDRVRRLIAEHVVSSKRTSPHVTSFIDADVTRLINWRNSVKERFLAAEGQKLTLTPIFIDATAKALRDIPMVNISVEGNNIIKRKNINIGMATALPDGNLIVPVIRNANEKSLSGIARAVNDLAERARNNKLKPDEITDGTFTLTNFGSYDNLSGTPIIVQPQAAILGTGAVRKVPAVIETSEGDVIAIRQKMILSLSYDHRAIDGALAGKFLHRLKEILENYTPELS